MDKKKSIVDAAIPAWRTNRLREGFHAIAGESENQRLRALAAEVQSLARQALENSKSTALAGARKFPTSNYAVENDLGHIDFDPELPILIRTSPDSKKILIEFPHVEWSKAGDVIFFDQIVIDPVGRYWRRQRINVGLKRGDVSEQEISPFERQRYVKANGADPKVKYDRFSAGGENQDLRYPSFGDYELKNISDLIVNHELALTNFEETFGSTPQSTKSDLKYYLDLRRKRLEEIGKRKPTQNGFNGNKVRSTEQRTTC